MVAPALLFLAHAEASSFFSAKQRYTHNVVDHLLHGKAALKPEEVAQATTTAVNMTTAATSSHAPCQSMDTYVFGYGSLMNQASVWKTNCHLQSMTSQVVQGALGQFDTSTKLRKCLNSQPELLPVRAKGIRRGWYARGKLISEQLFNATPADMATQMLDLAPTYLGATIGPGNCTGVIYKVSPEELASTDARELGASGAAGYTAEWLKQGELQILGGSDALNLDCTRVRWYRMRDDAVQRPSQQFPVVQSYVDIFVGGGLELEQRYNLPGFVRESILSTDGWSKHWVNDRSPAYRPFDTDTKASQITHALLEAARTRGSPLTMQHIRGIRLGISEQAAARRGTIISVAHILLFYALTLCTAQSS